MAESHETGKVWRERVRTGPDAIRIYWDGGPPPQTDRTLQRHLEERKRDLPARVDAARLAIVHPTPETAMVAYLRGEALPPTGAELPNSVVRFAGSIALPEDGAGDLRQF